MKSIVADTILESSDKKFTNHSARNVTPQNVTTPELELCSTYSKISSRIVTLTFRNLSSVINNLYIRSTGFTMNSTYPRIKIRKMFLCHVG